MDKTIVIGLGGTGLETIRALRRLVVENHGSLGALPQLGFLYLDTTAQEIRRDWNMSVAVSEQ